MAVVVVDRTTHTVRPAVAAEQAEVVVATLKITVAPAELVAAQAEQSEVQEPMEGEITNPVVVVVEYFQGLEAVLEVQTAVVLAVAADQMPQVFTLVPVVLLTTPVVAHQMGLILPPVAVVVAGARRDTMPAVAEVAVRVARQLTSMDIQLHI